ncbi:acyltransferase family protein [Prevotella melaninogenica]
MSNKRILYFDALKFFAIWLVVLGHYLQEIDCGSVGSYTNQVIYTFHMPLFIMISGFFAQKGEPSFRNLIIKKTTTLLLPVIIWTAIIVVYSLLSCKDSMRIQIELKGNSWYLKVLFLCLLYQWLSRRFISIDWIAAICSIILLFVLPFGSIFQFNFMYSFFWLGYFIGKNKDWILRHTILGLYLTGVCFLLGLFFMFLNNWNITKLIIDFNCWKYTSYLIVVKYYLGFCGSMFFIFLFKEIADRKNCSIVAGWGSYTLGIYVMQTFIIQYLFVDYFHFSYGVIQNYFIAILLSCITCFICILSIRLLSKYPLLDLFLFGNQYSHNKIFSDKTNNE